MAINTIQGFNPSTTEPIDSRVTVANETARLAFATFNVYEGLVVYQEDTDELYVLNDAANPDQTSSWSTVGGGSGFPFTGSASISGSLDVVGNTYLQDAYLEQHLYHAGDTNTYLRFDNDQIRLIAANYTVFDTTGYSGTIKIGATNNPQDIYLQNDAGVGLFLQKNTGNVGIGTTSPSEKLHVVGDATITGSLNMSGSINLTGDRREINILGDDGQVALKLNDASSGATDIGSVTWHVNGSSYGYIIANGTPGIDGLIMRANTNRGLTFQTNGANNRMRIQEDGNVGIGTTSPSAKLHVFSDTHSDFLDNGILLDVSSSDEGEPAVAFRNQSDMGSNYWIAGVNNGGGNLDFAYGTAFTSANTKVRITSDGKVGIGTTSPASELEVNGSIEAIGNNAALHLKDSNNDSTKVVFDNLNGNSRVRYYGGNFSFLDQGSTETLTIADSTGNVGIGTTSPSTTLHVSGSGGGSDVLLVEPAGAPTVSLKSNSTLTDYSGLSVGNKYLLLTKNSGAIFQNIQGGLRLANGLAAKSVITEAGYFGIGHNSINTVNYPLDVSGSANISGDLVINDTISTPNNTSLRLEPSGSTGWIFLGSPTDGTKIYHYSRGDNGQNAVYDFDAGYYRINTTSTYGFNLQQDTLISGDLTVSGKVTAEEFHTEFVSASIIYQSGSTKFGDTLDDTHSFTGSLEASGGFAWIPDRQQLQVAPAFTTGQGDFKGIVLGNDAEIRSNSNSASRIAGFRLYNPNTSTGQLELYRAEIVTTQLTSGDQTVNNYSFVTYGNFGLGTSTPDKGKLVISSNAIRSAATSLLYVTGSTSETYDLARFVSDETDRVVITNSGSVGIGTTSPTAKTHIVGDSTSSTDTSLLVENSTGGDLLKVDNNGTITIQPYRQIQTSSSGANAITIQSPTHQQFKAWTNAFRWLTQNGTIMELTNDGKLGIGTTSPSSKLHIDTDSQGDVALIAGYGTFPNLYVGTGTQHTRLTIASGSYNHEFFTRTSTGTALERLKITGGADTGSVFFRNSQVGVNVTNFTTDSEFEVRGDITIQNKNGSNPSDAGTLYFAEAGSTWGTDFYGFRVAHEGSNNLLAFQSANLTTVQNILTLERDSGEVGIGTLFPAAKLDVVGSIKVGANSSIFSDGSITMGIDYNNNETNRVFNVVANNSTELFRVQEDGNVGIGTTNPTGSLQLLTPSTTTLRVDSSNSFSRGLKIETDGLNQNLTSDGGTFSIIGKYTTVWEMNTQLVIPQQYFYGGGVNFRKRGTTDNLIEINLEDSASPRMLLKGSGTTDSTTSLRVENSNGDVGIQVLDNGNVGIGTTSPVRLLHLSASDTAINPNLLIEQAGTGNASIGFKLAGSTEFNMGIDNADGNKFKIHRNYAVGGSGNVLTIDGSNNVGIGTTSPAATLDVRGTISQTVDGSTNQYPLSFYNDHSGTDYYLLRQRVVNSGNQVRTGLGITGVPDAAFVLGSQTDQILKFATSGRIRNVQEILGSGTLEITSTDIRLGDGNNSQGSGIVNIVGASDKVPVLVQQQSGSSQTKFIRFLDSGSTEVMGITTDGGFIASTDTLIKRFSYSHAYDGSNVSDGQGVGISLITDDSSNNLRDIAYIDAVQDDISEDESSLRFSVGETTPTEVMRLQSDGNVGIGVDNPSDFNAAATNLVVGTGAGSNGITVYSGTSSAGGLYFADESGSGAGNRDGVVSYNHSSATMDFKTGGNQRVLSLNTGTSTFTIGDVVMENDLTVKGIVTAQEFHTEFVSASIIYQSGSTKFGDDTGDTHSITGSILLSGSYLQNGAHNNSGKADFAVYTGDYAALSLQSNQVQIGSTDMNYVARFDSDASNATIRAWEKDIRLITQGGSTTQNIQFHTTDSGTTSEKMRITGAGNVGIGTTSPDFKLDVAGDIGMGPNGKLYHNGDHNTYIGFTGDTQTFRTGGTDRMSVTNTGVGIGTTSPEYKLDIQGDSPILRIADDNVVNSPSASAIWMGENGATEVRGVGIIYDGQANSLNLVTSDNGSLTDSDPYNAAKRLTILESNGNVGIGTTSPSEKLDVNGTVKATAFVETSARKFKENIEPISSALETVTQLQGVTFNRIGEQKVEHGFIADEVKEVIPELVSHDANGEVHGVHYARTVAVLTEAIKELDNKVKAQDLFIKDLVARIEKLENK